MPVRYGISEFKRLFTVNVQVVLSKHFRTLVNGQTGSIEYPPQHVFRDGQLHTASRELDMRGLDVHS